MSMNPNNYKQEKKKVKTDFKVGTQMGRIVQVINMGNQHQTIWNTNTKQSQKLYWKPKEEQTKTDKQTVIPNDNPVGSVQFKITVEFPNVRATDDAGNDIGPAWLSRDLGAKSKALAALAASFNETDLGNLANKEVMCPIDFTSGGNAKIVSVVAAPEGVAVPELQNPEKLTVFDFYEPNQDVYSALAPFIQKDMLDALDFSGSALEQMVSGQVALEANADHASEATDPVGGFDDDIPFAPLSFHG